MSACRGCATADILRARIDELETALRTLMEVRGRMQDRRERDLSAAIKLCVNGLMAQTPLAQETAASHISR